MTPTRTLSVEAPLEPPELPAHFKFCEYEVTDSEETTQFKKFKKLADAADHWFANGPDTHVLTIYAESDPFPTGGTETIYAMWEHDHHTPEGHAEPRWDGWYYEDGNKFDPEKFDREFTGAKETDGYSN